MANGTVTWFAATKGLRIIASAQCARDAFVDATARERAGIPRLDNGQALSCDLESDHRGRDCAIHLVLA
jgi:CspA family cold shock protein